MQVGFQQRSDLELAPVGGRDLARAPGRVGVEEVEARHRIVRGRHDRLLDDLDGPAVIVEGHDAVAFGIGHVIAEDGGTLPVQRFKSP